MMPSTPMISVGQPRLLPGNSANIPTVSVFVKTSSAAEAWDWARCEVCSSRIRRGARLTATNSSPISAPVTPTAATKKSTKDAGTIRAG